MPGFVLAQGATVLCMHGGQAQPTAPLPRVRVAGQAAVGQATTYTVAGCPLVPPPGPPPCVSATWVVPAVRVRSTGIPLVLTDSTAVCVPTGTGLLPVAFQVRVKAS
jgi:hypothetical protein